MNAATTSKPSLSTRVASGVAWSGVSRVALQFVSLVSTTVVARRIDPSAYGLVNMAQIVIGLLAILRDIGVAGAVIQRRELGDRFLSTMFWVNAGLGVLGTLACFICAGPVAAFYRTPDITPILQILSVSFIITNLSTVQAALLNREMQFRKIAVIEIISAFSSLAIAVSMAYSGAGVWSLVAASLGNATVSTVLFLALAGWRPQFHCSWDDVRSMSRFGLNLTGFNLVNYFARNADNLLIGRYLGASVLGFYQFAYTLMLYPIQSISQLLGRVLFPAFSELQDDEARFRRVYLRACAGIALITFPLMGGLAVVSDLFIYVLLGTKWLPVAPLVSILAPVGMVQSIGTTVGQIYTAKGRTDWLFRWGIGSSLVYLCGFAAGLPYGAKGVACGYAISTLVLLWPMFSVPFRLIHLSMREFLSALWPMLAAALAMTAGVGSLRYVMRDSQLLPAVQLTIHVSIGVVVYAAILFALRPPILQDVLQMAQRLLRRSSSVDSNVKPVGHSA